MPWFSSFRYTHVFKALCVWRRTISCCSWVWSSLGVASALGVEFTNSDEVDVGMSDELTRGDHSIYIGAYTPLGADAAKPKKYVVDMSGELHENNWGASLRLHRPLPPPSYSLDDLFVKKAKHCGTHPSTDGSMQARTHHCIRLPLKPHHCAYYYYYYYYYSLSFRFHKY